MLARLGGDEFAVLLEDISNVEEATAVADDILKDLQRAFQVGDEEVFTTASIGIALSRGEKRMLRDGHTIIWTKREGSKTMRHKL